jgi:hypothetical protein
MNQLQKLREVRRTLEYLYAHSDKWFADYPFVLNENGLYAENSNIDFLVFRSSRKYVEGVHESSLNWLVEFVSNSDLEYQEKLIIDALANGGTIDLAQQYFRPNQSYETMTDYVRDVIRDVYEVLEKKPLDITQFDADIQ